MLSKVTYEPSGPVTEKAHYKTKVEGTLVPFTIERSNLRVVTDDSVNDNIVVLCSGWTETEDALKPLRHQLAVGGLSAITVHHPRYIAPNKVLRAPSLRVENLATIAQELVNDFGAVSLAGHSMGGIDVTRAVYEKHIPAKTLVLLGSAGLIASSTFEQVAPNVLREIIQEESTLFSDPLGKASFARKSIFTILRNPALAASEGLAAATHYVGRHIPEIAKSGTVTVNIMAEGDKIFPPNEVLESTKELPFDIVEVFKDATHSFTFHKSRELAQFMIEVINSYDEIINIRKDNNYLITESDIEADLFLRNS